MEKTLTTEDYLEEYGFSRFDNSYSKAIGNKLYALLNFPDGYGLYQQHRGIKNGLQNIHEILEAIFKETGEELLPIKKPIEITNSKIFRPEWVEPKFMTALGFDLISDKDGYLKYANDDKNFFNRDYHPKCALPKGKLQVFFNLTYQPESKVVFVGIREDWDSRNCYNGICDTGEFLAKLIQSAR